MMWKELLPPVISLLLLRQCEGNSSNPLAARDFTETQKSVMNAPPMDLLSRAKKEGAKVGVLLLNLGGPETGDDVEGFLYNLFADPDIIRLPRPLAPLQRPIAQYISKKRSPKSRAAYASIGGGSPIMKYTTAQADLLKQSLKDRYNIDVNTYIGMRYWKPYTETALEAIKEDGVNILVVLPLYPQFSVSTSGSSLRVLQEVLTGKKSSDFGDMLHTVIPSWYYRPGYIKTMAKLIQEQLNSFRRQEIALAKIDAPTLPVLHVLFSAHGVPNSYIEAGDPYKEQIEQCVNMISEELYKTNSKERLQIHLSYQSRVGPVEWLRPYTDDVIPELGAKGVRNLVVVPISFVSEHIETLEEIDMEYRELALKSGILNWRRCPALNTDEDFISDMADMVYDAIVGPIQTVPDVLQKGGRLDPTELAQLQAMAGAGAPNMIMTIITKFRRMIWKLNTPVKLAVAVLPVFLIMFALPWILNSVN